jgi:predicted nucleotidyltransferase
VATRVLEGFLERVAHVNESRDFLYKVETAVLFGSYLAGDDRVGDVDLAVALERQEWARETWRELCKERVRGAEESERSFKTFMEELLWPRREVLLFLKARSRTLSIVDLEDHEPLFLETPYKVLIGDQKWQPQE